MEDTKITKNRCYVCFMPFDGEPYILPDRNSTIVCSSCYARFDEDGHRLCGRSSYFCDYCVTEFDDFNSDWQDDFFNSADTVESNLVS